MPSRGGASRGSLRVRCRSLARSALDALDAAARAGLVEADRGKLRFSHPLLASAVLSTVPPARRRQLHALAARSASGAEERARHAALAADGPADLIAADLEEAAGLAERRGAPGSAAELLELAASLTPPDQVGDIHRRLLAAGKLLNAAGETDAARAVLHRLAGITPPGPLHAEALAYLGWYTEDDFGTSTRLLAQALAEAGEAPALSATIHSFLSDRWAVRGDPAQARAEAYRALAAAEHAGQPALLASLLAHAFLCDWRCDGAADETQLERALELERHASPARFPMELPSQVAGMYLMQRGRLDEAEQALERALARAETDGVEYSRSDVLLRLSFIATWKGDPGRGAGLAGAGLDIAEQLGSGQLASALLYGCGYAALLHGQASVVTDCASRGQELSRQVGDQAFLHCHELLLGSLDLALGNYAAAAARLRPLVSQIPQVGRNFETALIPEAAEALMGAGFPEEAAALLAAVAHRRDPVIMAAAARCRGMLAAAQGRLGDATAALAEALRLQGLMTPEPVERGRVLIALGGVQRRLKQRRAARESLSEAIAVLDKAEASLWAARARGELARVSGRPPGGVGLTVTEQRVAELVAKGLSNRAAAAEQFVTVRTIESTLTKVYAKLGLQSRSQLASYMKDKTGTDPPMSGG